MLTVAVESRGFGCCTHRDMTCTHKLLIRLSSLSICITMSAIPARAQGDPIETALAHVGAGAGINFYSPSSSDGKPSNGLALAYRWHSFHSGWGPTFGLDWHTTDFTAPGNGVDTPLGSLRMRALLAGYGSTRRVGRF